MATPTGALPDTQAAYAAMVTYLANNGITATLADYGGVRTQADTTRILQYRQADYTAAVNAGDISSSESLQQFRPISPYGSSYHNYGAAFDLLITGKPSGMTEYGALAFAGAFAPSLGLRWGGTFQNPDPPHFELATSLADVAQRYSAMTGGMQVQADADPLASDISDLSNLLPELTPDPNSPLAYADPSQTDDSGEADNYLANVGGTAQVDQPGTDMLLIGLLLATVAGIVWAARRRLSPSPA